MMRALLLLAVFSYGCFAALPLVDPGLFVISGVQTCGNGNGYCLLGLDCTLDEDFVADDLQGHCEGLKYAFTPSAHFVCCKAANVSVDHSTMIFPGEESEETTGKLNTTAPNVLENEIETMLLKLAASINGAKKNTTEETDSEEDAMLNNGTETSEEENAVNFGEEILTESYEEMEDTSGENLTTPDLSGDQAYGENNTNVEAEWFVTNGSTIDHREDIINKVTIKSDLNEVNDVVISTLDKNEQLNNIDSFYSIMRKEIEHLLGNVQSDSANSSMEVPTVSGQGYNQSVIPSVNAGANNTGIPAEPTVPLEGHYRCADNHGCVGVRFMYEDNQVCFGAILSEEWVLTSASCALRIFRLGMQNITTQRLNTSEQVSLRTIVVHENYRESEADSSQIGANNIGLVRIKNPIMSWRSCLPCLPFLGQDFSGNNCSALFNHTRSERRQPEARRRTVARVSGNTMYNAAMRAASPLCTGAVQPLVGEYGTVSFLTLACGTSWRRRDNNIPNETGAPLLCNGVLAGIETSSGIGTLVYTPVSRYMGWLIDNAKPPTQAYFDA